MSQIKLELHTKSDLNVGDRLVAEIKNIQNLSGESEKKSVCIINQNGRRARVLGYVNNIPQYTTILPEQLVEAMEANNAEKIEVVVEQKMLQKIDERTIYLLSINNYEVASYLLGKNINGVDMEDLLNSFEKSLEAGKALIDHGTLFNMARNTVISSKVLTLKVSGSSKLNPAKPMVARMLRDGITPNLSLTKDEDGKLRVLLDGEYAGEATCVSNPSEKISLESIESIVVSSFKSVVYELEVTMKGQIQEVEVVKEEKNDIKDVNKDEELFSNIMQLLTNRVNDGSGEVALTVEDLNSNQEVIDTAWNIVGLLKGESINPVAKNNVVSINKPNELNLVKEDAEEVKAKKVTRDEVQEIIKYLEVNDVPQKYIEKIITSYKDYAPRYLERIPSIKDAGFTVWKYSGRGENLLKLAIVCIERGKNLRLVGGKGAGKNTLLSTLAWVYQRPLFSQSANRDTDITHLFGDKTIDAVNIDGQVAQTVEFEKGLLVEAMEVGGFYEFGEGNACRPEVTMALHSVLDSRREADVNGYQLVKAHDDFAFILTMNVDYEGCNSLNQAFRDRFTTIVFPSPLSIVQVLKQACPTARMRDIELCDKLYVYMLDRVQELQTDELVTIRGYINALDLAQDISLKAALQMCVAHNVSDDELMVQEILEAIDSMIA